MKLGEWAHMGRAWQLAHLAAHRRQLPAADRCSRVFGVVQQEPDWPQDASLDFRLRAEEPAEETPKSSPGQACRLRLTSRSRVLFKVQGPPATHLRLRRSLTCRRATYLDSGGRRTAVKRALHDLLSVHPAWGEGRPVRRASTHPSCAVLSAHSARPARIAQLSPSF